MDVSEIKDRESFEAWLEGKPIEWAQAIAARCALRVAPMAWSVAALSDDVLEKKHRENLTLLTFRANLISSAGRKYPADDMRAFADFAGDAASASAFAAASAHASAAAAASAHASAADAASAFASAHASAASASAHSASAADAAGDAAFASAFAAGDAASASAHAAADASAHAAADAFWNAVRADCLWLAHDLDLMSDDAEVPAEQAQNLMAQPLWLAQDESGNFISQRPPAVIIKAFDKFQTSTLAQETSFGLIADWYIAAQEGKTAFNKKADLAIALMSKQDWGDEDEERDCIAVMDRVAKLAGWSRDVTRGGDFYLEDDEQEEPYYASRGAEKSYFNSEKIKHTLKENKNVVLSMCHSLLLQIAEYKEKIRGKNQIDEQTRNDLIAFLGNLEADLKDIVEAVVTDGMRINDDTVNRVKSRLNRFNYRFKENLPKYFEPEHLADIIPPVSIILGCGSIGALFGGPVGFGIGAFVGKLVTQEAKPGQSSDKVREMFEQEDTNINS